MELLNEIKRHNRLYRAGNPEITDAEYDALVDRLRAQDPENDWFKQAEPAGVSGGRKRKLPVPMKSLNKVKSLADIMQWLKSLGIPQTASLVVMPKYDGVSWLHDEINHLTYSRGGAENEGQDCTEHFAKGAFTEANLGSFPAEYTFGELVFSRRNWEEKMSGKISDSTGEPYRSPRNTVAGFINRDEAPDDIRHASFIRYGVDEGSLYCWNRFSDLLKDMAVEFDVWIYTNHGRDYPFVTARPKDLTEEMLADLFAGWRKYYYIDGLVIYLDELNLWKALGRQQTTGNPLYAIAYKHPDFTESFETKVTGTEWNVSKAGALKPVVLIEPVDTGDCVMESPTGYNARWCLNNGVGTGAEILVTRSGGVIPKIIQTIKPVQFQLPERCPVCGSPVRFDKNDVELCCLNPDCDGRRLAKINHFLNTVGVENIGEEATAKLFASGFRTVRSLLDITADELMSVEGFGEGIAGNFLSEMEKIKKGVDLATLMHASDCFRNIGRNKARKILSEMTLKEYDYFIRGAIYPQFPTEEELAEMPVTRRDFIEGVAPFSRFLSETKIPVLRISEAVDPNGKYQGISVCFSHIRDRDLENAIISGGGKVVSGVSKNTTHLIVKDVSEHSSKIDKAKTLGVRVISIDDFKAV